MQRASLLLMALFVAAPCEAASWAARTAPAFGLADPVVFDLFNDLAYAPSSKRGSYPNSVPVPPADLLPAYIALCLSLTGVRLAPSTRRRRRQAAAAAVDRSRTR